MWEFTQNAKVYNDLPLPSILRTMRYYVYMALQWRHNGHDSVSNLQPRHCLLNRLFGCRSKKTSKPRVTGLCVGNSPGTVEFSAQMASIAENVSIWWRHHGRADVLVWIAVVRQTLFNPLSPGRYMRLYFFLHFVIPRTKHFHEHLQGYCCLVNDAESYWRFNIGAGNGLVTDGTWH